MDAFYADSAGAERLCRQVGPWPLLNHRRIPLRFATRSRISRLIFTGRCAGAGNHRGSLKKKGEFGIDGEVDGRFITPFGGDHRLAPLAGSRAGQLPPRSLAVVLLSPSLVLAAFPGASQVVVKEVSNDHGKALDLQGNSIDHSGAACRMSEQRWLQQRGHRDWVLKR